LPGKIPHLKHNPHVDVAVVNLAYDKDSVKLNYDGFGFLTPHPSSENTHPVPGTLGIVFDSNTMSGQEQGSPVKLTVMLGGHMWDSTFDRPASQIDPNIIRDRAIQAVEQHLGIKAAPTHTMTNLQLQCIPQYRVGHYQRLTDMHAAIKSEFGHRLSVTGASYWGVSVPDCIKNSRELVEELTVSGALGSRSKVITGLGRVEEGNSDERLRDSANISKGHINVLMKS
jgi:oxygen-dependent protoporphyrinogen oxidase